MKKRKTKPKPAKPKFGQLVIPPDARVKDSATVTGQEEEWEDCGADVICEQEKPRQ